MLKEKVPQVKTIDQIGWHSLIGFFVLLILSIIFKDNPINQLYPANYYGLITAFHGGIFVSLLGHGGLFYLYKFYPVGTLLPFYSLFPIFGIFLTFLIFFEIPGIYEIIGGIIVISSVYLIHRYDQALKAKEQLSL